MARLGIEVAYATRERQEIVSVAVEAGATALDAVRASGMSERHPELDAGTLRLGIFGSQVAAGALVAEGDRVEIYRPLQVDPKAARRAKVRTRAQTRTWQVRRPRV